MVDNLREAVAIRITSYQQRMANLYNKNIKSRTFRARDLVLRKVFENTDNLAADKFQQNWEGLYIVV